MENYRTTLNLEASIEKIRHEDKVLSIGSCFAENIGSRLLDYKFLTFLNPFGILFNPISISNTLSKAIDNQLFTEDKLIFHRNIWHSLEHHGSFSNLDKNACLNHINKEIINTHKILQDLDFLILTLGTANVFVHQTNNEVVANCHKLPNNMFSRKRLSVGEITETFEDNLQKLKVISPKLKIIFTVSPVRHIRDGLVENQRSKATLLLAVDELIKTFDFVRYFPAYELVLDDLRDYRFFNEDMIHPSKVAIDYVWQRFSDMYFDEKTKQINQQIKKIIQAKNHRPFEVQSIDYQQFINNQIVKIRNYQTQFPTVNFETDLDWFQNLLK